MKEQVKTKVNRGLPHNNSAEQSLLGCVLVDSDIGQDIFMSLVSEDFFTPSNRIVAEAMVELTARNIPVEFVTVVDELERTGLLTSIGGISYVSTLNNIVPSALNYKVYLDIVKRDSTLRKLIHSCSEIIEDSYTTDDKDKTLAFAEKLIYDISSSQARSELTPISESVAVAVDRFDIIHKNKDALRGIKTGFKRLDAVTNGLHGGELIIIAARPGVGKSSLAMNIVENAAKNMFTSAVFSLEMPKEQIAQRMLSANSAISMSKSLSGTLDSDDWNKMWAAHNRLAKYKIYLDDNSMITPSEILTKCRRLKSKQGLDLIIIDYIQLMSSGSKREESRQQEVSTISRTLKIIAKELNVPIIALSQMSRSIEKRDDKSKRPQLSDLRESGAIEQDADIVMFIHKKSEEGNKSNAQAVEVELIIAKHRNGEICDIPLNWLGEILHFEDRDTFSKEPSNRDADNKQKGKDSKSVDNNIKQLVDKQMEEVPTPEVPQGLDMQENQQNEINEEIAIDGTAE